MSAEAAPGRGFESFTGESIEVKRRRFTIRRAVGSDLPALVALLRDDVLGAAREGSADVAEAVPGTREGSADAGNTAGDPSAASVADDSTAYAEAFALIADDPNQLLVSVVEGSAADEHTTDAPDADGRIVGTLQLSLVPSLSRRGTVRLQIEAVRIGAAAQGIGLGTAVFEWAHDCGRRFGAGLAQLTTDKSRADAQRFYARLGYVASHEGLKLRLG